MGVIKVIEIIGESTKSWEAAAQSAVKTAAKTLRGLVGVDVVSMTATIKNNKIATYRSTVKIAFVFES